MIAQVTIHIHGVRYVITIEGDGILADRAGERKLEQPYLVVIKVYIGKHVLQCRIEDVAGGQQLVDTGALLSHDDVLFRLRVFTIDVLRDRLIHRNGQYQFVIVRTCLYLVYQPLLLGKETAVYIRWLNVVDGQRYLLILVVLIVGMIGQVGLFLCSHHTLHQLHGRIVFPAVAASLLPDHHFGQRLGVGFQFYIERLWRLFRYRYVARLIAHGTEGQHPSFVAFNAVASLRIAAHGDVMSLV